VDNADTRLTDGRTDANAVHNALFDAESIIAAISDNTPAAVTVAEQTLIGRITGGHIAALNITAIKTLLNYVVGDIGAAAASHSHAESDVTNLTTDLSGKEPSIGTKNTAFNKNYGTGNPVVDGSAGPGSTDAIARIDHVHPTDTSRAASSHNHAATEITNGSLDGDRLPAISTTKRAGVPAAPSPSGKFLKDDDTWAAPAGGATSRLSEVTKSIAFATTDAFAGKNDSVDIGGRATGSRILPT
jgi:hypothetical protein